MSLLVDELRLHTDEDERPPRSRGDFVLYWLHAAHRVDDNFALAFAIEQANAFRLPILVYQELTESYRWASDRFHTFVLEGVVDLQAEFERLGVQYAFSLTRGPLMALAERAALVVTDHFPTAHAASRLDAFRRSTRTPVIAVDSCTVVPLRYHGHAYESTTAIRPVLLRSMRHFLAPLPWVEPRIRRTVELPFEPVRPTLETIPALVAGCEIDHTVPPSPSFRGGLTAARARLRGFVERGFPRYLEAREDPNDEDGTSRLSPYLHFGQISFHEVLRAVREPDLPEQYDKFLDEAFVWRELAHNFSFHDPHHCSVDGIPYWAAEELRRGEHDPRPVIYSTEDLEHARTDEELWNAAQRAYRVDGWVHHTVRTLWGKTVLQWTPTVAACFRTLIHLNDKYALDGSSPTGYTGILWTLGKFDRPFYRRPIYGAIRYQSLKSARKRFDVRAYVQRYAPTETAPPLAV